MLFWQNWVFLKNLFLKINFVGSWWFIAEARTLFAVYIWLQAIPLLTEVNRTRVLNRKDKLVKFEQKNKI